MEEPGEASSQLPLEFGAIKCWEDLEEVESFRNMSSRFGGSQGSGIVEGLEDLIPRISKF